MNLCNAEIDASLALCHAVIETSNKKAANCMRHKLKWKIFWRWSFKDLNCLILVHSAHLFRKLSIDAFRLNIISSLFNNRDSKNTYLRFYTFIGSRNLDPH